MSSRRSGAASITSSQSARSSSAGAGSSRSLGPLGLLGAQPSALDASLELAPDPLEPALERLGHRVVQQRPRARQAGQLRDPRAHRAGAGHAERPWRALGRRALTRGPAR